MTVLKIKMPNGEWADIGGPEHAWATVAEEREDTADPAAHGELVVNLEASSTYLIDLWLWVGSQSTDDVDIRIAWLWDDTAHGPIGDSIRFGHGLTSGSTDPLATQSMFATSNDLTAPIVYGITDNPLGFLHEHLVVRTAGEGGEWRLAWAQGVASGNILTIYPGSHLRAEKTSTPFLSIGTS